MIVIIIIIAVESRTLIKDIIVFSLSQENLIYVVVHMIKTGCFHNLSHCLHNYNTCKSLADSHAEAINFELLIGCC